MRCQREATAFVLVEDADGRECAEQPIERAGVGVRRGRELVTRPRAVGEEVGDAERRRDVNRLAHLEPDDQATEGCARCLVHVPTLMGGVRGA